MPRWACGDGREGPLKHGTLLRGGGKRFFNAGHGSSVLIYFSSWFGLSWEELNLHQPPKLGFGGLPPTQGSLTWGAMGTGLLLSHPEHPSLASVPIWDCFPKETRLL